MAKQREATSKDINNVKKALVSAGVTKATTLSKTQAAKINAELARQGVDTAALRVKLICSRRNYCIIIRDSLTASSE